MRRSGWAEAPVTLDYDAAAPSEMERLVSCTRRGGPDWIGPAPQSLSDAGLGKGARASSVARSDSSAQRITAALGPIRARLNNLASLASCTPGG